ncbi:MAG: 2-dehydro-3-deoxygalactonokinase [Rhodobacteraceae bacterium]|jgi:2-dehydro-3-deoxygalactonokinase|nr:2-dehydro-3-deoxygalactonokinase [Paracoccaceae bacterium]
MITPDWIAVDWGTTRLRAFAMGADGSVLATARSDAGMGTLTPDGFEPALLALIDPWLTQRTLVIACGMVGSRQGWVEAPYAAVPCPPLSPALAQAPARDPRLDVRVIPGLKQARPADVMRGEETQIAGALAARPGFDGVLCLPGSHTKWAHVSAAEVVSFQTCMTGEVFAALTGHTVLRHTVATDGHDDAAFAAAVDDALSQPARLTANLFGLRASALLDGLSPVTARSRLSGWLIGMELAASCPWWLGQPILILGAAALSDLYQRALAQQGAAADTLDADAMTLAGLTAARATLKETAR